MPGVTDHGNRRKWGGACEPFCRTGIPDSADADQHERQYGVKSKELEDPHTHCVSIVAKHVPHEHSAKKFGSNWKAGLVKEFKQLGDKPSADCDYDWADESGHIRVGLAWTRYLYPQMSKAQVIERHTQLKNFWTNWMREHHENATHGYEHFMQRIEKLAAKIQESESTPSTTRPAKLSYGGTDVFEFDMPPDSAR
jgi:hypothetical protein